MWLATLVKRFSFSKDRLRKVRRRAARRLLIESLEGRRVLTSGVPFESFDGVFDPALPPGWVSTGTGAWTTVATGSHTANNHAFIPNPSTPSSGVLSSAAFTPTAQSSIVNFAHSYNTEATYDGGILEIAIPGVNNGLFQEITAAGGTFITGGYNSTINPTASGTLLAGRQAWSGNSGGYVATSVKLPQIAIGQNIQLAWRFVTDTSVGGVGWRVDSISMSGPVPHIDLANLAPSQGSVLFGEGVNDESGKSVAIVGDVNGDGYDDMLIGAPIGNGIAGNLPNAGQAHLVFGGGTLNAPIDSASEGSTFYHDVSGDQFGRSVGSAGDFNGDGFGDFFVGADQAAFAAGEAHVFFGNATGSNFTRIKFTGIDSGDQSGFSVSSAGDVNGDGFDDLLVGARSANSVTNGRTLAGESYLIFGKGDWTANQIVNLATVGQVGGPAGVTFFGSNNDDQSGISVSGIGDVNGDGFDDLAIGAFLADGTTTSVRSNSGETAILFGKSNWTGITSIDLATLGSNNGLTIFGVEAEDYSGISVSRVGDLNGDGFDDIAIGAYRADAATNGKGLAGDSYIVFGASSLFGRTSIDLATLGQPNQPTGITIFGAEVGDRSGYSISGGGDLNGDGFDDLVIGAKQGDALLNLKTAAGDTYVVFGGPSLPPTIDLATLGANALAIFGANGSDQSGTSVSLGGDVNGDGFDDLLIGANLAASLNNSRSNAGESYLIFGGNGFTNSILPSNLGNSNPNGIVGSSGNDILNGGDEDDTLLGNGEADVLLGGRGNDFLSVSDLTFKRIVGGNGNDTLALNGSGFSLDLTNIPDNRIVDIETIELPVIQGNSSLTLNHREVLNISSTTNTLTVNVVAGNRVFFESGWTKQADDAGFQVFTKGAATLRVTVGVPVLVTLIELGNLGSAGTTINGAAAGDYAGRSVSSAGDVNGDGYDDFIIGANRADLNGQPNTDDRGKSYVIFGGPSLPATINLLDNLGTAGITITGQAAGDRSGFSVSSAGDVNGDGFDDLIVGAIGSDPGTPARESAGKSYVIFGGQSLPATITLSDTLSTTNPGLGGFTILGQAADDRSGFSVSSAGDVNGDGFDDLIVGASYADPGTPARNAAGKSYVIFGKATWNAPTITLSDNLGLTNPGVGGFAILGQAAGDYSGYSVSNAGDVNGDGLDDIIIVGAPFADVSAPVITDASKSYVIFGKSDWSATPTITLSDNLAPSLGFIILGQTGLYVEAPALNGRGQVALNDLYVFQSPGNAANSVLILTVNRDAGVSSPTTFGTAASGVAYEFNIDNNGDAVPDVTYAITFSGNGATQGFEIKRNNIQIATGTTGSAMPAAVTGGGFASAGLFDDPFFFDIAGFQNGGNFTGANAFGASNVSAIVLEVPNAALGANIVGIQARTLENGTQVDRTGRPAISTFLISGSSPDRRDDFNQGNPVDDFANFGTIVNASIAALSNQANADALDNFFLPDLLTYDSTSNAGYLNGRRLQDDVIDISLGLLTAGAVTTDGASNDSSFSGTFPYLAPAQTADLSGFSVSSAGDVNGDGFDDLIVGADRADPGTPARTNAGKSYVIFGKADWSTTPTINLANLSTLGPTVGITIFGADANDQSGISVSIAGDVNGDGFDDLLIGATFADASGNSKSSAGDSYVIFGAASLPATIDLANLGSAGITIFGADAADASGRSVTSAGDVNGDGFDDLLIGAIYADASGNGKSNAGESYVIFGGNGFTNSILPQNIGTSGDDPFINGTLPLFGFDILNGGDGNDQLVGNGGTDILLGGRGDDILRVNDLDFKRLIGGNGTDELRLTGGIFSLNLLNIPDNRIVDIERIEINASSLTLTQREVLNISSTSNTLTVIGTPSGRVGFEPGWTKGADSGGFQVFTKGAATLRVSVGVPVSVTLIDLADLGSAGTTINGAAAGDLSGRSVSNAGDVNGDGYDDFIIGAFRADAGTPARTDAGKTYVIFGGPSLPATITLSDNLGTTNPGVGGFTISGEAVNDQSGSIVSSAGDVNGDGFDDLIVGARIADPANLETNSNAGKSYVIFGGSSFPATITLSDTLSTTNSGVGGFTILGQATGDYSGHDVSSAGDVNGDGFDDLIVGAFLADPANAGPGDNQAGKSYVIFGGSSLPATITLSDTLSTTNPGVGSFTILGQAASDFSGFSVSGAGDVNGDGFDDLIVGAFRADRATLTPADNRAGKSYVIFGGSSLPATITLSDTLSTTNPGVGGFTILGQAVLDFSGTSVSSAGDINGDGFDDLIVGASNADPGNLAPNSNAGKSYVIFGGSSFPATITLSDNLSATNPGVSGFTILGQAVNDLSGGSVSGAGDVNGDGFDDLIVGAYNASPGTPARLGAGKSYVIFGKSDWSTTPTVTLSDGLGTTNPGVTGFTIFGETVSVPATGRGIFAISAGDVNGDGFDDLIVGAPYADPANAGPGNNNAGKSYILYGGNGFTNSILPANLGNSSANTINGTSAANILSGANGDDILVGLGGADILLGGRGNDTLAISNLLFRRIVGGNGNDTLRLDGTGLTLDLTTIRDNRIVDIETINITGSGNNTLTLTAREVLNLSSHSNTLIVRRNSGDVVNRGPGWTQIANETISSIPFEVFTQGRATLKVQASLPPVVGFSSTPVAYIENAAPLAIFSGVTITDVDSPVLTGGVLTISNTNGDLNDRLTIASSAFVIVSGNSILVGGQVVGTFTGGTGTTPLVVTLTSQASLNRVVAILSLIRFSNVSDAPSSLSRIISVRVTDGSGGTSATVNRTVGVTPVNDIPVVTLPTTLATYVENAAPIAVFTNATVTDADTPVLTGGVLTITNTNGDVNDRLTIASSSFVIVSGNSILVGSQVVGTFTGGTGTTPLVVTLTNQASLNRIVAILSLIRFSNISDAPSGVSRIISVRVTDGSGGSSVIVNRTVGVTPVIDAPILTLPTTPVTYIENAAPLAIFTSANVTDVDTPVLTGGVLTITNTNGDVNDRLTIASSAFVIVSGNSILVGGQVIGTFTGGNGTTPLVVTFTNQASLNRVLAILSLIRFSNVSEAPSGVSRIISVRLTDGAGGTSTVVNRTVGVTPVIDAPVVTLPTTPVTYVENSTPIVVFTGATVTDADTPVLTGGVLTITNTNGDVNDRLTIASSAFVTVSGNSILVGSQVVGTFTGGTGTTPFVVTFTSQASLNRVLAILSLIRFSNISDAPIGVSRIISVRVTDGAGGTSTTVNRTVGVTPVNDAPVISSIGPAVTFTKNGPRVLVFSGTTTISDLDNTVLTGGKLTITNTNGQATDSLAVVPNALITVSGANVSYNGSVIGTFTGGIGTTPLVFTFNSQATPARIRLVLLSVGFSNSLTTPSATPRTISVQITDGVGGTSALQSKLVNVV